MEQLFDFMERLETDTSMKIIMSLEDARDLAAISGVSKSWRRFVIKNGLSRQLCLKLCPDLSKIVDVAELTGKPQRDDDNSTPEIPLSLTRDHRVFSLLSRRLTSFPTNCLIRDAICSSSPDILPENSINNTLTGPDFWRSKGESNHSIPESLVYELRADFCVISELHVLPFQAYDEPGRPTYCAEVIRFSIGRRKPSLMPGSFRFSTAQRYDDDMFVWTYTSPEFPMAQAYGIQRFQLPRPVLCMGSILKVELLGRVQKSYLDGLYYFCMSRVQATGWNLRPEFYFHVLDDTGSCILRCHTHRVPF
ncbi:hypothetical protein vseg_014649 [Gypsophila vaccaria]